MKRIAQTQIANFQGIDDTSSLSFERESLRSLDESELNEVEGASSVVCVTVVAVTLLYATDAL